jgi:predicted kinase
MLYGYPGAGKSHFASQFCEDLYAAHIYGDRMRHELFEKPTHGKRENEIVDHLMQYMTEEFLKAGISVVYDTGALRQSERRALRDLARKYQAKSLLIWLQVDMESAFLRIAKRDRRKAEEKYASHYDRSTFDDITKGMQNPKDEDFVVISGKHTFNTQKNAVVKKMYSLGLINMDSATARVAKPGLVNLVPPPRAGRVDVTRRNIVIR